MHLATHLMMLMLAAVACRAAFIPNMMFSSGRQTQQPKSFPQQAAGWRSAKNPLNPWNDASETYGYLADRHSNAMADMTPSYQSQAQLQQPHQPMVYGVAHRYLSEPSANIYPMAAASVTDELYNNQLYNNALMMRGGAPFNAIKRSSSLSSFYDDDSAVSSIDDGLASDYYDQPISHEDVANFEKYVQRYFQQEPTDVENQYGDYWNVADSEDEPANNYDVDNDEEAARQLHLLLKQQKQQRRPIALREIQKKSVPQMATTATRTETPVTTATTYSSTMAPQTQQGQKEEPLLRPPTPQRQPQPEQVPSTTTTTASPSAMKKEMAEENNIFHTIQRLMNMRNHLQKSAGDEDGESSAEDDNETNNRAKRFVAPSQDSLLSRQIHSLDKIKA